MLFTSLHSMIIQFCYYYAFIMVTYIITMLLYNIME